MGTTCCKHTSELEAEAGVSTEIEDPIKKDHDNISAGALEPRAVDAGPVEAGEEVLSPTPEVLTPRPVEEETPADGDGSPTKTQDARYRVSVRSLFKPIEGVQGNFPRRKSSENITLDEYLSNHSADFDKILALERPDGWIFKKEEEGVKAYCKSLDDQPLVYFKGVCDFDVPKEGVMRLVQVLLGTEERPKWDELCTMGCTPEYVPPFYKYGYVKLRHKLSFISPRDLLTVGRMRFEDDGGIITTLRSEEHPGYPELPGFVRAQFIEGGYIFRPTENPSVYRVTWTACVDPKGWLPTALVNLLAANQAMTLAKVKEYLAAQPV